MKIPTKISYPARLDGSGSTSRTNLPQVIEHIDIELREAYATELEPAFKFGDTIIYANSNRLYIEATAQDIDPKAKRYENPLNVLTELMEGSALFTDYGPAGKSRRELIFKASEYMSRYLLVDPANGTKFRPYFSIYREVIEPRYCVMNFGDNNIGGGTGLFVTVDGNRNLPLENYFSALDGDWAVAYANQVAAAHGNTKDIGTFEATIEVLKEDEVCWPTRDQNEAVREFIADF